MLSYVNVNIDKTQLQFSDSRHAINWEYTKSAGAKYNVIEMISRLQAGSEITYTW